LRWQADLQKEKTKVPIFKPSGGMLSLDPFPRHQLGVVFRGSWMSRNIFADAGHTVQDSVRVAAQGGYED
jgi:hypothetical protein